MNQTINGNKYQSIRIAWWHYSNVMISGRNVFDQPVRNDIRTYKNIRKIATGQGYDHTVGGLLDYPYFQKIQVNSCRFK